MNLQTIIKKSVKGNSKGFGSYFLAVSFSVFVIFVLALLTNHPDIPLNTMRMDFQKGAKAVQMILFIFLALFIAYSSVTYSRQRSRDYAILKILGTDSKRLLILSFCENFVVYFSGVIAGILLGVVLSKLIFMFIAWILGLEAVAFYVPLKPALLTILCFAALFIIVFIVQGALLKSAEPKEILSFGVKRQHRPKIKAWAGILGLLLVAIGYYLAYTSEPQSIISRILPVTGIVILGTYLLYNQFFALIINYLTKRRSILYKGTNILWLSNLLYRVKDSSIVLFLSTIIIAVGLTAFATVYSVMTATQINFNYKKELPLAISADSAKLETLTARAVKILDSSGIEYKLLNTEYMIQREKGKRAKVWISESNSKTIDTAVLRKVKTSLFGFASVKLVGDLEYDSLKVKNKVHKMNIFDYKEMYAAGKELSLLMKEIYNQDRLNLDQNYFFSTASFYYLFIYARRFYLFLGLFFGVVFFVCAGSMLYFKFFNNLKHDVEKYGQYARIGLSQKELSWSTAKEMGMLFFLPNIMAVMHTLMALTALNNLGNGNFSILMPVLQVLAGTLLIQTIYFVFMHKRYSTQLKRALKDV